MLNITSLFALFLFTNAYDWDYEESLAFSQLYSSLTNQVDISKEKFIQNGFNFSLPGYKYCGPGTPFLYRISNWSKNAPINKLDLACFYHDIAYSNYYAEKNTLRWADYTLMHEAKTITEGDYDMELNLMQKFRQNAEARLVIEAFELKIELEDLGLFNSMDYKTTDVNESTQIFEILRKENLPKAWNLPFYFLQYPAL